ncbi:MAG: hypothetical protein KJ025_20940 [Burkholderiales bacterium]|nr:hypothetical protein [Burkholderiales bacterium]
MPLSVAATVVLSATITLMVYESEEAPPPFAPAGAPAEGERAPAKRTAPAPGATAEEPRRDRAVGDALRGAVPGGAVRQQSEERNRRLELERKSQAAPRPPEPPASPPARAVAPSAPPPPAASAPGPAAAPVPAPFPADEPAAPAARESERVRESDAMREPAKPLAKERAPAPEQTLPERQAAPAPRAAPAVPGEREAESGLAAPAPPLGAASSREDRAPALVAPEDWVAEIRRLRRAGRDAEAAERLAELKQRFPGYALPDDLR